MWKVYLLEFIIVFFISLGWVYLLDKCKDEDRDKVDFP